MAAGMNRGHVRWGLALQTSGTMIGGPLTTSTVPLYATNDPPITAGINMIDVDALDGDGRYATDRTKLGVRKPGCSGLEIPWNAYTVPHILATLFQYGADTTGLKTFVSKATTPNPINSTDTAGTVSDYTKPWGLSLMRAFTQSGAEDHYLYGAIAKSVTISGDTTGAIMMSVDFIGFGYGWTQTITLASGNGSTYGLIHPFCNFGGVADNIKIATVAVQTRSFSITIDNGAVLKSWNAADPGAIGFAKRLAVTGELTIICDPADATYPGLQAVLASMIALTEKNLTITSSNDGNTPNAAGEWQIMTNFIPTAEPETVENDNIYDIRIPFRGVYTSGAAPDVQIIVHNGVTGWAS